jgi:hypothetical protein
MGAVQKPVTQPKRPAPPRTGPPPVTKAKVKVHLNRPEERSAVLRALQRDYDEGLVTAAEKPWVELLLARLNKQAGQ